MHFPPLPLSSDNTIEVWHVKGHITDVRVTRGFARYGRLPAWRRWLGRWFPSLLIHWHRSQPDPTWQSVLFLGKIGDQPNDPVTERWPD
jgi:hypothetical protein